MTAILDKIKELEEVGQLSKHEQLVDGILNAIDSKVAVQGDRLPSVNEMVKGLGFARKTIVKAYSELKDRGIVSSRNRLGYFISNEDTSQVVKVALLMYAFHPFQEIFYNTFRKTLGDHIQVDVFFHHSNMDVFETAIRNINGHYGLYVVAPIPNARTAQVLRTLPEQKLLLVDRFEPIANDVSHVTQEFAQSTFSALMELRNHLVRYRELVFFFKKNTDYPIEVLHAFQRFIRQTGMNGRVEYEYRSDTLRAGTVYYTIGDSDLWGILKDCRRRNWQLGNQIGVISNDDSPVKELLFNGITTLSTDFELMARTAAKFVLDRQPVQKIIPTRLIMRHSL